MSRKKIEIVVAIVFWIASAVYMVIAYANGWQPFPDGEVSTEFIMGVGFAFLLFTLGLTSDAASALANIENSPYLLGFAGIVGLLIAVVSLVWLIISAALTAGFVILWWHWAIPCIGIVLVIPMIIKIIRER